MSTVLGRSLALAFGGLVAGLGLVLALFGGDLRDRWAPAGGSAPHALSAPPAAKPEGGAVATSPKAAPLNGEVSVLLPEALPPVETDKTASRPDPTPSFDIVRVEPNGESVVAGRARPETTVELLVDGKPVAQARTDRDGQFAIVPPPLAPGSSEIVLRSTDSEGRQVRSNQSVAVALPPSGVGKPLVALSAPDRPTQVLSQPDLAASRDAAKPTKPMPLRIVSVDAQENGRLFVNSEAPAGAAVRLYLNDTLIASGRVGTDGKVTFTIGKGVRPGTYRVRVDQVDLETGKVRVRAEVPLSVPESARIASRTGPEAAPRSATDQDAARTKPAQLMREASQAAANATPPGLGPAEALFPTRRAKAMPPAPARQSPDSAPSSAAASTPSGGRPESRQDASVEGTQRAPRAPSDTPSSRPMTAASAPDAQPDRPSDLGHRTTDSAADPAPHSPGSVFVPEISTARIERGNNLWQISKRTYGRGNRYTVIYDANQEQIRDPDLIYPGQILVLPEDRDVQGQVGRRRG